MNCLALQAMPRFRAAVPEELGSIGVNSQQNNIINQARLGG